MNLSLIRLAALGALLTPGIAAAQDPDAAPAADTTHQKGIYVVARAGGIADAKQKLDNPFSSSFPNKTKFKIGGTGEIGGGYDFGMFRLEQTLGYSSTPLDRKKAEQDGSQATGRNRAMTMTVSGFVDIPLHSRIEPFIGGGVGVSRVDARLSRTDAATGTTSSYRGKDWGLSWHGDAGIGYRIAPGTVIEVAGRYTRTSKLRYDGQSGLTPASFEPKLSNISGTIGLRYTF